MKNSQITRKITQGMYIVTTPGGGCVVDAVSRVGGSGESALVAVAVAKTNHSHQLLSESDRFALSVLGQDADPQIIQTFGFCSSRDTDKLSQVKTTLVEEVPVLEDSLGYLVLDKIDSIDTGTHTLFIGRLREADLYRDAEPMTYADYQAQKSQNLAKKSVDGKSAAAKTAEETESADDLEQTTSAKGKTAWVCKACGYVYYGDEVPDDYRCPLCGLGKEYFVKQA